ncbi:hypothetical protein [Bacillus cereus]|uniref:hypothetical protein n=1 Tax=Bacillus cereus TaxID=1396 RepID=UPI0018CDA45A|nr:hypothetical protein [Bacillus cereus]MBG9615750.1 hypothetical protein [Bacillus cereus]
MIPIGIPIISWERILSLHPNPMEHGKKYRDPINDSKIYYLATTGIAVAEGYDTVKKEYFLKTVMSNVLKPGQNWNPIL